VGLVGRILCGVACAAVLVAVPVAAAGVPPNTKDPCVSGTKDICGTTGVGYYQTYSFGTRWFGDFKNAIPGGTHSYCIDLRFWYPGPSYKYKEDTSGNLRNKSGGAVPAVNQQRIAYAIWVYGRSSDPDQAAAVMLYVHGQIDDARPGEVSPAVLNAKARSLYDQITKAAAKFHGPYKVAVSVPGAPKVGTAVTATVRVLAGGGAAVPNLPVTISTTGATGVSKPSQTDDSGVAKVTLTPSGGTLKVSASSSALPSTLPRVFVPTSAAAAANGQRLVLPASQTVSDSATGSAAKTQIQVSTAAAPTSLLVGKTSQDKVTISNAGSTWSGTIQVRIYGPARTQGAIVCTGTPAAQGTLSAKGNGTFTTTAVVIKAPGWYAYQETVPGYASTIGLTTPCNAPSERFRVDTQPAVVTTVSSQSITPGTAITDTVKVTGLAGESATVTASLYGPFATRAAIVCTGTPASTGTLPVTADGTYTTQPVTVQVPGYYTYRESIAASGFVRAAQTACADTAETAIVTGQPKLVTQVSAQQTAPGATITDKVTISGLGVLQASVKAVLYGPYASTGAIKCTGTPFWQGTFTVKGDGTYTTAPVKLTKAGYYTYQESIADTPAYAAFTAPCAASAETTLAHSSPTLSTQVTDEVARPGAGLTDKVTVSGLGSTAVTVEVTLYGPFSTRASIGCSGTPAGKTSFTAKGSGTFTSPPIKVEKAGFYVFREAIAGSALIKAVQTSCTEQSEVSLAAPLIITGRGDVTRQVRSRSVSTLVPSHVRIAAVNIDAPVVPVGIDVGKGVLGVSPDIHRTGWWADGATPGDTSGSVLIAGHVDNATQGAGAFFNVKNAKPGDKVEVTTSGGRTFTYKVQSVKSYPKSKLPTDVWSKKGKARLVLVTCGGKFDQQKKHYVDNIVLTAVPG
jgi:LPXTG-site transpeptidase (sortase) family protein